jgi:hypothetical protein
VRGLGSLPTIRPCERILSFVNGEFFFNSYVNVGTENLALAFMDKTKGKKNTGKRAISAKKQMQAISQIRA